MGLTHVVGITNNLLNKNSSPTTNACEDFLMDVTTPKMFFFFSIKSLKPTTNPSIVATYV
jgi:hypothetical protein